MTTPAGPNVVPERPAQRRGADGPPFSWSASRERLLRRCARAYYLQYYAAHGGWAAAEGSPSWLAYRFKKLTTLPAAVGTAVHRAAGRCVRALVAREPLPGFSTLRRTAGAELNGVWRGARDGAVAFRRNPAAVAMLDEFVYGSGPDTTALERARATLDGSLRALTGCDDLWETIRRAPPEDVVTVDPFWSFALPPDDTTVYAAPDLLVRPSRDALWEVTDFKTGRPDGVIDQLLTYGVAARHGLGLPVDAGLRGRVVALGAPPSERVTTVALTVGDVDAMAEQIRVGVDRMQALLADRRRNAPLPLDAFPACADPRVCQYCAYRGLCHPQQFPTALTPIAVPADRVASVASLCE